MHQHYQNWLVLVSVLVAILASYTALTLALRIRVASKQVAPAWLLGGGVAMGIGIWSMHFVGRSEEHTSELQSQSNLVCRLLLEKKKKKINKNSLLNSV